MSTTSDTEDELLHPGASAPLPSMYQGLFGELPATPSHRPPASPNTEPDEYCPDNFLASITTSPVVGTREERHHILAQKQARQREQARTAESLARQRIMKAALDDLNAQKITFGDLMDYVFDPQMGQRAIQYSQFFIKPGRATQILNWWVSSSNSNTGREEVKSWAVRYTAKVVKNEARDVTKSKTLQTAGREVDERFVMSFSYDKCRLELETKLAPVMMTLLRSFSVSNRQRGTDRGTKTDMVITSAALSCLGEFSHANNYSKKMLALYLYASGASRQTISIMCTLGYSASWSTIISNYVKRDKITGEVLSTTLGILNKLSLSMRQSTRTLAAKQPVAELFDNVNIDESSPEQIIGRHDMQENGTCATVIPLFKADFTDLRIADFQDRFLRARKLELTDILHTQDEKKQFRENLIFTILRVIITHGGERFKRFEKDLAKHQPKTADIIEVHKTRLYPLPAMHIDESSIIGNVQVADAIMKELAVPLESMGRHRGHVRFKGGDQLSLSRLRSIEIIRAGHEKGYRGFFWGVWMPGLFHVKMADTTGTFINHWGKPDTGAQNPGSLWYHNTHLDRLPIVLTSLPPFRTCRDLVFVSLYARVLHCLLRVAGGSLETSALDKYAETATWDSLYQDAAKIHDQFATASIAADLRDERESELARHKKDAAAAGSTSDEEELRPDKLTTGDMLFENGVYFIRDALLSREFSDAIKCGDSGRVVLVLKIWALAFRGNGRTKYAYEMLDLFHHIEVLWSPSIRKVVFNNWIINPTGKPNSFVEIDLAQEHLIYWIKVIYKAHGSAATWEWLEMVAPTVDILRRLSKQFNDVLGADQGTKHAPAELAKDVEALMDSLRTSRVYELTPGRVFDDNGQLAVDVVEVGLQALLEGARSPLNDYNESFERLQRKRRTQPVKIPRTDPAAESSSSEDSSSPATTSIKSERDAETEIPLAAGTGLVEEEPQSDAGSGEESESDMEDALGDLRHHPLYDGDAGDGPGDEAAMPRRTEADVAFDMDAVVIDDDEGGAETDSDGEVEEGDGYFTDEEV